MLKSSLFALHFPVGKNALLNQKDKVYMLFTDLCFGLFFMPILFFQAPVLSPRFSLAIWLTCGDEEHFKT